MGQGSKSNSKLLEDGAVISEGHAIHDQIRRRGGLFSHWGNDLVFSTSDCTDPRVGTRKYELVVIPEIRPWVHAVQILLVVTAAFGLYVGASTESKNRAISRLRTAGIIFTWPLRVLGRWPLALAGLTAAAWLYLGSLWLTGTSSPLSISGHYQISDASIYWHCSNALLERGNYVGAGSLLPDWCQRRPIYSALLAGIKLAAFSHVKVTLLLQAALLSAVLALLLQRVRLQTGEIGTALVALLLFAFAMTDAFPLTMTENAGLFFGCIGLSSLLAACQSLRFTWAVLGMASLSFALNARAGAMFVLPALVAWAIVVASHFRLQRWSAGLMALAAVSVGFVAQAGFVLIGGGSPTQSHGNFSYTLYGLAVGGKGWLQVLTDHPELLKLGEAARHAQIYELALDQIRADASRLVFALGSNLYVALAQGTYGYGRFGALGNLLLMFWIFGGASALARSRQPAYALVLFGSLGALLSAPIIINDGGPRVFAATIAFEILQIGIGVQTLAWFISQRLGWLRRSETPIGKLESASVLTRLVRSPAPKVELRLLVLLFLLAVAPYTPARHFAGIKATQASSCSDGLKPLATRLNRESLLIAAKRDSFAAPTNSNSFPWTIPIGAWWTEEAQAFRGGSLMSVYQLDHRDPFAPGHYTVRSDQDLSAYDGQLVTLCIDEHDKQSFFGEPYRKLISIVPAD